MILNPAPTVSGKIEAAQRAVLSGLLKTAETTDFGWIAGFKNLKTYEAFVSAVPVQSYLTLLPFFEKAKEGQADVLWPGTVQNWAVSSGTTGAGKHLPLSNARLTADARFQVRVGISALQFLGRRIFDTGKILSLPGSLENGIEKNNRFRIGEVSAFTALSSPRVLSWPHWQPPRKLAGILWPDKLEMASKYVQKKPVHTIVAAPVWINRLIQDIAYPEAVRLLITGGSALSPFIEGFSKTFPNLAGCIENYGASEGYFAFGKQSGSDMLAIQPNNGVLYEFQEIDSSEIVPLWKTESGKTYQLIVSTNAGLWRYLMDDLVQVDTTGNHARIKIIGRSALVIDQTGEAVYQHELAEALEAQGITSWLATGGIDRSGKPCIQLFTTNENTCVASLDAIICRINRHYAIRRSTEAIGGPVHRLMAGKIIFEWEARQLKKSQSKVKRVFLTESDADLTTYTTDE